MILLLLILSLFLSGVARAQVIAEQIDADGKDTTLPVGKAEINAIPIKMGDNKIYFTLDRASLSDPKQVLNIELWSLIDKVWTQVCGATLPGEVDDLKRSTLAAIQCSAHGGTEAKAYVTTPTKPIDTKLILETKQVATAEIITPIHHSVAFDNSDTATATGGPTSITISNFAVAATNPLILCGLNASNDPSGTTFNSVPMTLVTQVNNGYYLELYRLHANSGTHDVVGSFASSDNIALGCASFTGVDQTTPVGSEDSTTHWFSTPISLTVPSNGLSFDVAVSVAGANSCDAQGEGSGQVLRFQDCEVASATGIFASTRDTSGDHAWTNGGDVGYANQIGVPINAAAAVPTISGGILHRRF